MSNSKKKIRELEERLNRLYNIVKGISEVQRSHNDRITELEKR